MLATVTTGLWVGWSAPSIMQSDTRLRGRAVWEFLTFALNGLVFSLIGLQLSFVVGWAGLRGVVSLALSLSLLLTPGRAVLLAITFGVILVTLVGQGPPLPLLTRLPRIHGTGGFIDACATSMPLPLSL